MINCTSAEIDTLSCEDAIDSIYGAKRETSETLAEKFGSKVPADDDKKGEGRTGSPGLNRSLVSSSPWEPLGPRWIVSSKRESESVIKYRSRPRKKKERRNGLNCVLHLVSRMRSFGK